MQQNQYENEQYSHGYSSLKSQRKDRFLIRFRMSSNGCVVQTQDLF
jgi:hypothetical protein